MQDARRGGGSATRPRSEGMNDDRRVASAQAPAAKSQFAFEPYRW